MYKIFFIEIVENSSKMNADFGVKLTIYKFEYAKGHLVNLVWFIILHDIVELLLWCLMSESRIFFNNVHRCQHPVLVSWSTIFSDWDKILTHENQHLHIIIAILNQWEANSIIWSRFGVGQNLYIYKQTLKPADNNWVAAVTDW